MKNYMKKRLQADGYYVTAVSEYRRDKAEIPCRYYMSRNNPLDKDVIYTVEHIYEPDIIIFFLDRQRFHVDTILDMIDIHISKMRGAMKLNSKDDVFASEDYSEIYEYVVQFFTEQEC